MTIRRFRNHSMLKVKMLEPREGHAMTTRLYHFSLVLMVLVVLFVGGCGGSVGVEVAGSSPAADAKADDHVAAATMAAAEATSAAAQATGAAAAQVIAQATAAVQASPTATAAPLATQASARAATATAAPTQTPMPAGESVEPQGQKLYLHSDGILALVPPPSNSQSRTECLSECTQTWAITLTNPLQGNAYNYDLVGISGDYSVRLLHTQRGQQTVLAEWLNRDGWQGGPEMEALPGDVLTLEVTAALGASWSPFSAGSILAFDYGSYSYVTVGTTQKPLPTHPAPPKPTPVVQDLSTAVEMRYGDVITEEIKPCGDMDIFTFAGNAGDVAHIVAAGTEDAPWLSLRVEVFDPQGAPVKGDSHGEYDLTLDGRHSFTVQDADTRTGSYLLSLKNVSPGAGTSMGYGDVVEGEIGIEGEKDVYTFDGKTGDVARIAMSERRELHARKANLVVTLLDPHGETLGYDDIWVGNIALIGHALDTDGLYTIEIRITGQLDTPKTGEYTLLLKNVAHSTGSPLTYGNLVEGEIEPPGDRDVYTFEWRPGEEIVIEATGNGRDWDFQLQLEIFDPQARSVALGSAGSIKPTLSDEGTYTLVVQDESGHAGSLSTGSYTLLLKHVGASAP